MSGLNDPGLPIANPKDILDGGFRIGLMCRESLLYLRQSTSQPETIAHWNPICAMLPGFDQLDLPVRVPIVVIDAQRSRSIKFVHCIASPIPHRQVHLAIAIEVTRGDARPPATCIRK